MGTSIVLLCGDCLPADYRVRLSMSSEAYPVLHQIDVPADRDDLGPMGTASEPRKVPWHPAAEEVVMECRPGESVVVDMTLPIRFSAKSQGPGKGDRIEYTLDRRAWRADRNQYEDTLRYVDRVDEIYLEVVARSDTGEVVWSSGVQPLRQHLAGGPRPSGPVPPWVRTPLGSADPDVSSVPFGEPPGPDYVVKLRHKHTPLS